MKKTIFSFFLITVFSFVFARQSSLNSSIERGKKLYEQYCLTCHQADGGGVPKMNPPLINTSYVTGDKQKLVQWVLKGSTESVPIDGKYYSNNMPPQAYLKDEEIADILTYIRNSFGNKASAITATEVKGIRAITK
ncbi:MAG TPA: cytochrome c [Chitinophagaceae bacterium]|jgi:mono/diheme cytochrome c family protein